MNMIFLQLWWTLMVLTGSNTFAAEQHTPPGGEQLHSFREAFAEVGDQLQGIHSSYDAVQDSQLYRHKRNSIDELLDSFGEEADKQSPQEDEQQLQQAADDWFRELQADNARQAAAATDGGKHSRGCNEYVRDYGKMLQETELGKVKKKYKDMELDRMDLTQVATEEQLKEQQQLPGGATELDIKLKHVQQLLAKQEQEQQRHRYPYRQQHKQLPDPDKDQVRLPEFGNGKVPDGVYESTLARLKMSRLGPNNLAHEANYKLSKAEQEAAERAGKSRFPGTPYKKRSSASFNGCNPMNEIKLKTSNRLMLKGLGPSLPSNALQDNMRAQSVDELLLRREVNLNQESSGGAEQQQSQAAAVGEDSAGGSFLDSADMLDSPQSYDYRLPSLEHFQAPGGARSSATMRDYARAKSKADERYKRQKQQVKENQLEATVDQQQEQQSEEQPKSSQVAAAAEKSDLKSSPSKLEASPMNANAMVKVLASKISQQANSKIKRWIWQRFQQQQQQEQQQHHRSRRSLDSSNVGGKLEEVVAGRELESAEGQVVSATTNIFDNPRHQVPMMSQRNNNLLYATQQQQLPLSEQQLLSAVGQTKSKFNLTQLLDELARMHKLPATQHLQHPLQQQQQSASPQQHPTIIVNLQQPHSPAAAAATAAAASTCGKQRCFNKALDDGFDPCQFTSNTSPVATTEDPLKTTASTESSSSSSSSSSSNNISSMHPDCVPITTTEAATASTATTTTTTIVPATGNSCSNADALQLKISMSGDVCSLPKTKQLFGNGSFSVQPVDPKNHQKNLLVALGEDLEDEQDERCQRDLRHPHDKQQVKETNAACEQESDETEPPMAKDVKKCKPKQKRKKWRWKPKKFKKSKETSCPLTPTDANTDSYDKLMSGKISGEIVREVFEMVGNDPTLEPLLPVLTRNRQMARKRPRIFYQIRSDQSEHRLQQTEEMIRETMATISDIIDKQLRHRSCLPLPPDLVEFYDMVCKSMAEQQKSREKRQLDLSLFTPQLQQNEPVLDSDDILQKSRILRKLLKQYDELPLQDQQKAAPLRDELLMDLLYLRKISSSVERNQRQAQLQSLLSRTIDQEGVEGQPQYGEYSPRLIKLLKTAEIFRNVGEQQAKEYIGL